MKKPDKSPTANYRFSFAIAVLGFGLIFVGLLEYFGLMRYKPNRQPLGATMWLIAGGVCLLISYIVSKLRN